VRDESIVIVLSSEKKTDRYGDPKIYTYQEQLKMFLTQIESTVPTHLSYD
jgi:hypothetical protein